MAGYNSIPAHATYTRFETEFNHVSSWIGGLQVMRRGTYLATVKMVPPRRLIGRGEFSWVLLRLRYPARHGLIAQGRQRAIAGSGSLTALITLPSCTRM
jgi:hypothetical protein